ncbi:MAG: endonuclease/exonuclease/phosphatase family protein [Gammaproteobacteria bacterium]|nr:endonuclease/exonuclease/phosphatase family protein [Gammaproteobacteria bacterium]
MKFLSYNIQYGKGKDGRVDMDRIVDEIDGADIVAMQELDRFWPRTEYADQVQQVTSAMPDYYWVYGAGVDLHADELSNHNKGRRRQFGNLLLSRLPIISSRNHLLPKYGSTDPLSLQRSALEATILCGKQLLRIYSIHLTHLSSQTRIPQINRLLKIHRNAVHEGFPVSGDLKALDWNDGVSDQTVPAEAILMGDFNLKPDSNEYLSLVGPVSDYGGHITSPAGFVDAWVQCGHDKMAGITTEVTGAPARLDYCFVSTSLRHQIQTCRVDDQAQGSDHQPLWTEIDF